MTTMMILRRAHTSIFLSSPPEPSSQDFALRSADKLPNDFRGEALNLFNFLKHNCAGASNPCYS